MTFTEMLRQYLRDVSPGGALSPELTKQGLFNTAAVVTAPVPVVGDVAGLFSDIYRFKTQPEERTPANFAMSALGVLPFVPAASITKTIQNTVSNKNKTEPGTIVFHGSNVKVDIPDLTKSGKTSGIKEEGPAFWVTPSFESAKQFAKLADGDIVSEFKIMPKNPLIVEVPIKDYISGNFSDLKIKSLNAARKQGNDSVVFKQQGANKLIEDEIAVLDTSILKGTTKKIKEEIVNPFRSSIK